MSAAVPLSDADMNGLVDGYLDPTRRTEVLRRLAASPADRARVEAWQDQNALLKSAFLGLEKETLPTPLRLVATPPLHFVPAPEAFVEDSQRASTTRRMQILAGCFTIALVVGGLGGAWMLIQSPQDLQTDNLRLRGPVDATLAELAIGAVGADRVSRSAPTQAATSADDAPPTTEIPDLSAAGFIFTSAEAEGVAPRSLVFHYRDASANRVVVSVARAPSATPEIPPTRIGRSFSWHSGETAYAIAGTVRPERLRAMAALLQGDGAE